MHLPHERKFCSRDAKGASGLVIFQKLTIRSAVMGHENATHSRIPQFPARLQRCPWRGKIRDHSARGVNPRAVEVSPIAGCSVPVASEEVCNPATPCLRDIVPTGESATFTNASRLARCLATTSSNSCPSTSAAAAWVTFPTKVRARMQPERCATFMVVRK